MYGVIRKFFQYPFRLVSLLFAAVTRWKRRANWLMMAALFTMAANLLILARTSNMTWSQTLQTSSFFHQNFFALNKVLNLFTGDRIMQFLAINTSGNILPAILLGKQRACGGNWWFSSRRLAVVFPCFYLLAGFSSFNFFLNRYKSSIFHTSSVEFRAPSSRISLGSLDIIIGINKLPYCSGDTPNEASPRVWTLLSGRKHILGMLDDRCNRVLF